MGGSVGRAGRQEARPQTSKAHAYQGGLQDDGHVGGVEELDGVGALLPAVALRLDGEVHTPALWWKAGVGVVMVGG